MVTIEKTETGLYMTLSSDPVDRESWGDFLEYAEGWPAVRYEPEFVYELVQCGIVDSWESEPGLTDAPAFWLDGELYGFMDYMIRDLLETLETGRPVFWLRATE